MELGRPLNHLLELSLAGLQKCSAALRVVLIEIDITLF
jgi:hypothetical protein